MKINLRGRDDNGAGYQLIRLTCNTAVSCLPFIADKMHSANYYLCTNNVCGLPLNNQNELISAIEKV